MKDIKSKKCGCVHFSFGPPVVCPKHLARQKLKDGRTVRHEAEALAHGLGHDLTEFQEYGSVNGKWTAYCRGCGYIAIVYDDPRLTQGDQICGKALTRKCEHA